MKWLRYAFIVGVSLVSADVTISQIILFPGLEGEALQVALRDAYRPAHTLDLSAAKDTLYAVIENHQDSVEGVYSGYTLSLPDGVDPSQWLFNNGSGINLEHVYPQSKGAGDGMAGHSDMHHLFPARVAVNAARASFPFADIPDALTTTWYRNDIAMSGIPQSDIDSYSEYREGSFEPRESVKGNIARAVFYFYTMYQDDADAADPNFFPDQRATLCAWHLSDPVDDAELERSAIVAHYQDGKENPFILDCTAALRAYCPEFTGCGTSGITTASTQKLFLSAYASGDALVLRIGTAQAQSLDILIFDMIGRTILATTLQVSSGTSEFTLGNTLSPGIYAVSCVNTTTSRSYAVARFVVP